MPTTKITELFEFDKQNQDNYKFVIGTDEAGRGPGAGPVVAAAVCFHNEIDKSILEKLQILNDSKKELDYERRMIAIECLINAFTELNKLMELCCRFMI